MGEIKEFWTSCLYTGNGGDENPRGRQGKPGGGGEGGARVVAYVCKDRYSNMTLR